MNTRLKPVWAGRNMRLDPFRLPQVVSYATRDDYGDVTFTIVVDYDPGDTPNAQLSFVVFPFEVDDAAVEVTLASDNSEGAAGTLSGSDADSLQLNQALPLCEGRCELLAEARILRTDVGEEALDVHVSALARLDPAADVGQQPSLREVSLEQQ